MEAARTCSRLLTPSIHMISGHVVSQTAVQVVADVLSKLLVVGITDPGKRAWILFLIMMIIHQYHRNKNLLTTIIKRLKKCLFLVPLLL